MAVDSQPHVQDPQTAATRTLTLPRIVPAIARVKCLVCFTSHDRRHGFGAGACVPPMSSAGCRVLERGHDHALRGADDGASGQLPGGSPPGPRTAKPRGVALRWRGSTTTARRRPRYHQVSG